MMLVHDRACLSQSRSIRSRDRYESASPTCRTVLPRLDYKLLHRKHTGYERNGIRKDMRDLELLEIQMNPETDSVRTTKKLDHEHDFPDYCDTVSRRD